MPTASAKLRILHLNDLHGHFQPNHIARVQSFVDGPSLAFDTGDAIKAGNLAIPMKPEAVWPLFAQIPLDAGTIGNRETHVLSAAFEAKIHGAAHPLLCANLRKRDGAPVLPGSIVIEKGGWRIGVFGVSVAMVTEKMATKVASAYIWDDPISTAATVAHALRPSVDVLIGLTHIGISKDRLLAEQVPEIDIILGGHSHTVLDQPERIGGTWICQGGSHARFLGVYDFDPRLKGLSGGLFPLKG